MNRLVLNLQEGARDQIIVPTFRGSKGLEMRFASVLSTATLGNIGSHLEVDGDFEDERDEQIGLQDDLEDGHTYDTQGDVYAALPAHEV